MERISAIIWGHVSEKVLFLIIYASLSFNTLGLWYKVDLLFMP